MLTKDLAEVGLLRRVLIPRAPVSSMVPVFPSLQSTKIAARLIDTGFPTELADSITGLTAATQLAGLGLSWIGPPPTASRFMYWSKRRFDKAAANWVRRHGQRGQTVLAVSGAAAETFRTARELGIGRVLHFVNAHPLVHNHVLQTQAGLVPGHHELLPDRAVDSVVEELRLASRILVPSRVTRSQLLEQGVDESKIVLVRYGWSDLGAIAVEDCVERQPRVLFIGQISYRKGVHLLVRAARALPGVEFTLVGPVVSRDLLVDVPSNVEYLSPRSSNQLASLVGRSTVGVMPSLEDSFPLAVLEMMGAGLPVVMSHMAGTSELVKPGLSGWVFRSNDAEALVGTLSAALEMADTGISERARDAVVRSANWNRFLSKTRAVLTSVVEETDE